MMSTACMRGGSSSSVAAAATPGAAAAAAPRVTAAAAAAAPRSRSNNRAAAVLRGAVTVAAAGRKGAGFGGGSNGAAARPAAVARSAAAAVAPVRYRADTDAEQQAAADEEYVRLDYDCTELLDLRGRASYLFCDVTRAYDALVALPLTEGYSSDVAAKRLAVLDMAKEQALYHEGRVQPPGARGVDLPVSLLPAAMALLAQLNQNATVHDLATKLLDNWDVRRAHKRDILLSLAVAHCNVARELLAEQQVAEACGVMEEALALLASASGDASSPPLAPALAADIQAAVDGMAVQRVLDTLRGSSSGGSGSSASDAPAAATAAADASGGGGAATAALAGAPPRARAVAMLRELLSGAAARRGGKAAEAAAAAASPDYVRLVVDAMGAREVVAMADWASVARAPNAVPWLYPGLLHIAATAHIAAGFADCAPAAVRTGAALLRAVPASGEVLLLRAVAHVLLGEPAAAVEAVRQAARAPADAFVSWPTGAASTAAGQRPASPAARRAAAAVISDSGADAAAAAADVVAATPVPSGAAAYDFLVAHSPSGDEDEDPQLLSGLCLLAEVFLTKVVFAGFPDTAALLAASGGGSGGAAAAAALPAYFDSARVQAALTADRKRGAGLAGGLAAVRDAVLPRVAQLAASAGTRLQQQLPSRSGGGGGSGSSSAAAALDSAVIHNEADDAAVWARPSLVGGALNGLRGAAAALGRGAGAAAARVDAVVPLPAAGLAAAAALAAAVAFGATRAGASRSAILPAPAVAPTTTTTASSSSSSSAAALAQQVKPLDRAAAARLVRRFQAAKAAALGSNFDAAQLPGVCVGQALQHFTAMSADWAARGWFRTSNVWKVDVLSVTPRGDGGAATRYAVAARVGEAAQTWGVDGQQAGAAWSNEYDVDYEVALCRDLCWRVEKVAVRGREPGAAPPSWLSGLLGGAR